MKRIKFDAMETATNLVNKWWDQTADLPFTLRLTELGFAVIEALERAYELGRMDGWEAKQSEISKAVDEIIAEEVSDANWEHMADEHSGVYDEQNNEEDGEHGEVGPDDSGIQFDVPDDEIPF